MELALANVVPDSQSAEQSTFELSDLQLALVGGGIGDVVPA
jgi:hypothetical protein